MKHRKHRGFFLISLMLGALPCTAQTDRRPQSEKDGLAGSVRSVSVKSEKSGANFNQHDVLTIVRSAPCQECEHDRDGNRTKSGFQGLTTDYVRDSNGTVTEAIDQNPKGEPTHRKLMGPFGPVEEQAFAAGVWRTLARNRYDERGNQIERTLFDENGRVTSRMNATFDEDGTITEQWVRGQNNEFGLHFSHTYDRATRFETLTGFLEGGSPAWILVLQDAKVLSYWRPPGSTQGSPIFFWDNGTKNQESMICSADGACQRVESTFLDDQKRNISRVEVYDSTNGLKAAADYQYEFDSVGNWLKRTVRVWTPELGDAELYETDYRTLTYW